MPAMRDAVACESVHVDRWYSYDRVEGQLFTLRCKTWLHNIVPCR